MRPSKQIKKSLFLFKVNKLLLAKFGKPKKNSPAADPVDALIATILSQNTTDINSYKAYSNLKNNFADWREIASANRKKIEQSIKVGGLAKQKAASIKNILKELLRHNDHISLDYLNDMNNADVINELIKFKGVGVKTASCVLLFSLKRNVCPVDTHVHRVLNRIGLVKTKSADKTFEIINENLLDGVAYSLHTNLIRLGRDYCKSGKPNCSICPLLSLCLYDNKNMLSVFLTKTNRLLLLDKI